MAKTIVAVYCRVSSDDQRNRETIKTQIAAIKRYLKLNPHIVVFKWYIDDGVSGTIPMSLRPHGKEMLMDAAAGKFTAILVVRADRLGRDEIGLLQLYATFVQLGVELIGIAEPIGDRFMFGIKAIVSADERRKFLARSAEGMRRAAEEGRYTGGVPPFGYRVEGVKEKARLVPDERILWGETTAAELVRQIYAWLVGGKSCYWIADHLNALGVPTAYMKDGRLLKDSRGRRTKATQGKWRPGRIAKLVKNPVYKGELSYGRRSKREQDVITAPIDGLIPPDVWDTAQRALTANRLVRRRTKYINVLRSVVVCGICGLKYSAVGGRGVVIWLRCNGQIKHYGKIEGRCPTKSIKLNDLAPVIRDDIERFLRDPGPIIEELAADKNETSAATLEAERTAVEAWIASVPKQRKLMLDRLRLGTITGPECDDQLSEIARIEEQQRRRLAELTPDEASDEVDTDLLTEIRQRLDGGLDDLLWQELVQHLVRRVVVHTEPIDAKRKRARIVIEYRFPGVGATDTGRD